MDKSNMPGIELVSEGSDKIPNYMQFLKVQQADDSLKSGRKQFGVWQRDKLKMLTDQFSFLALRLDKSVHQDTDKVIAFKNTLKNKKIRKIKH